MCSPNRIESVAATMGDYHCFKIHIRSIGDRFEVHSIGRDGLLTAHEAPQPDPDGIPARLRGHISNPVPQAELIKIGKGLSDILFGGRLADEFAAALLNALESQSDLEVILQCDQVASRQPWEAVYLAKSGIGFVALHPNVIMVRGTANAKRNPCPHTLPLKVAAVVADVRTKEFPRIGYAGRELDALQRMAATSDLFELECLPYATPSGLRQLLFDKQPHVLHAICHGTVTATGPGIVLNEGDTGTATVVHADELVQWLRSSGTSLAFLAACNTGKFGDWLQQESGPVPHVISMQLPMRDAVGPTLTRVFYSAILSGSNIGAALSEARAALAGTGADWLAPVMFGDGQTKFLARSEKAIPVWSIGQVSRHNFPSDERPFIGRTSERQELRSRMLNGQRFITISGPGGIGKTRLSKQVGLELLDNFPGGAWLVECETLRSSEDLIGGIAAAMDKSDDVRPTLADLKSQVGESQMLLILDCFEGITDLAHILDDLLKSCSGLHLIVTSRVVLGLPREHEIRLSPMPIRGRTTRSDAVALFYEAASHTTAQLKPGGSDARMALDICEAVEGVPLSIVLAAGRLSHMSLTELCEHVRDNTLQVLRRRSSVDDRHGDISRVIAASFDLLGDDYRRLLSNLTVFVGGFFLDDACYVCEYPDPSELMEALGRLIDHSLVQREFIAGRTRYRLLDCVRQYARLCDTHGDNASGSTDIRLRHAERYELVALNLSDLMKAGRWSEGTKMLWRELGNYRAAIDFARENNQSEIMARLADALARSFLEAGLAEDFDRTREAGVSAAQQLGNWKLEADLLGLSGAALRREGKEAEAAAAWTERLELAVAHNCPRDAADALLDLAVQGFELSDITGGEKLLTEAERFAETSGSDGLIATALAIRASVLARTSRLDDARAAVEQSLKHATMSSELDLLLFVYQQCGRILSEAGDLVGSKQAFLRGVRIASEGHRTFHCGKALLDAAPVLERLGEQENCAICLVAAAKIHSEIASRLRKDANNRLAAFMEKLTCERQSDIITYRKLGWRQLISTILS